MSHSRVPWMVRISASLYRRLLVLYPRAFRHECADDVAQVFADLAREAHRCDGLLGVLGVWGTALPDLVMSVLAERSAQVSGRTWKQLGGLCLMIGSALGGLIFIIHRMVGFAVFMGVQGDVWLSVAALLFIPGIVALHLHLAESGGRWRWLGTILAAGGVLLLALGQLALALHVGGTETSCGYHCISMDYPSSFLGEPFYSSLQLYGTWFAVVGLGTLSVIALLRTPFRWRTALPGVLVVGYIAFMSLPADAPAVFPKVQLLLLWVIAAFLLGRDLWETAAPGNSSPLSMSEAG